jgi:hypothetical protein
LTLAKIRPMLQTMLGDASALSTAGVVFIDAASLQAADRYMSDHDDCDAARSCTAIKLTHSLTHTLSHTHTLSLSLSLVLDCCYSGMQQWKPST